MGFTTNSNIKSSYIVRDSLKLFINIDKNLTDLSTFLIDEDILVIGSNLDPIKTTGGLVNPTIFSWDKGKKAKYYIKKSGGVKNTYRKYGGASSQRTNTKNRIF